MSPDLLTPAEGNALFVAGLIVGAAAAFIIVVLAAMRAQRRAAREAKHRHPGGLTVEKR